MSDFLRLFFLVAICESVYHVGALYHTETPLGCLGNLCYSLFQYSPLDASSTSFPNFQTAKVYCEDFGGQLASIKDQQTLDFVGETLENSYHVYTGLFYSSSQSRWMFTDGTRLEDVGPRHPFTDAYAGSYCATIVKQAFYRNDCGSGYRFLCQKLNRPCNVADLTIPNAIYDHCLTNTIVNSSTRIPVQCNSGYIVKKLYDVCDLAEGVIVESITCNNGSWSAHSLCVATCPHPHIATPTISIIPNKPFYFLNENITLVCPNGYFTNYNHPMSHLILTCTGVSQWEPANLSLECIQASNFVFAQKQYQESLIELEPGADIVLDCVRDTKLEKTSETAFVWFRDQVDIRTLEGVNYTLDRSNGSLYLNSFDDDDEGLYICLIDDIPSLVTYKIKTVNHCQQQTTPIFNMILNEDSSHLLICPEYNALISTLPPTWYKDGVRLWDSKKFTILPNGVLFLHNIELSDDGHYTCTVMKDGGFCAKNYTTRVSVTSVGSICGRIGMLNANPWLVSLWWEEEKAPFCYGARINDQWVITSASCLFGFHRKKIPDFFVNIGRSSGVVANTSRLVPVDSVKIYPFYSRRVNYGDIGLVKLKTPLQFWKKDNMKPLCLPETDVGLLKTEHDICELPRALKGSVSGWGTLEAAEPTNRRSEELIVAPSDECQLPASGAYMADSMFCATGSEGPEAQAGDSGSPFHLEWKGKLYLYGIFSWGERASKIGKYDYYTKVSAYTKWILTYVQKN